MMYIYFRLLSGVHTALWAHELVRCIAMYLSHTKTLVLEGIWGKGYSTPHYLRRMEGKNLTLFWAGVIVANYSLKFFYAVSAHCGWVIVAQKPLLLVCFHLCLVAKLPLLIEAPSDSL